MRKEVKWIGTRGRMIILAVCLCACLTSPSSTGVVASLTEPLPSATPSPVFSGDRAMRLVEAQMAYGPRPSGSEALRQTGDFILTQLTEMGWDTQEQSFEYRGVEIRNLVGRAGSLNQPVLLLGAHYDTRRRADQDTLNPEQPVPGANDGASGVAVLLELARVLDLQRVQGVVWLVFFDAEDNGRLDGWDWVVGSRYFASQLTVRPEYVIIVDMVGDADQNLYYEGNSDPILQAHLWALAAELGYIEYFIPELRHTMLDDHVPFRELGIPAVDVIDFDYPHWHTGADTIDKLDSGSLERVGRVLEVFLEAGGRYPGGD